MKDSFQYTDDILLIPAPWVPVLLLLDGTKTVRDIQETLTRSQGGQLVPQSVVEQFVDTLRSRGFLDSSEFHQMRARRHEKFRQAETREPVHAGTGYPADADELRTQLAEQFGVKPAPVAEQDGLVGIAAPHVSPTGGVASYGAAYRRLGSQLAARTFVILGTSHYGAPHRFGLTRKPYVTPMGNAAVDVDLVDRLVSRAGNSIEIEDYCHAIEHSIEFQVIFLQQALGPQIRILPILCGPIFEHRQTRGAEDPSVERFVEAVADLAAAKGEELFWVLGVDMAHIGSRYGDRLSARAGQGQMRDVQDQDRARLARICEGDAAGFAQLVQPHQDQLKWCGYAPFFVFLKAMELARPALRGRVLEYEQWNIDEQSVVSFGALEFSEFGGR